MREKELVFVEWIDSHSYRGSWEALEDIVKNARPSLVRSIGWVVSETDEWVAIVSHLANEDQPNADPFGFSDLSIPKVSVVRLIRLADVSSVLADVTRLRKTEAKESECTRPPK